MKTTLATLLTAALIALTTVTARASTWVPDSNGNWNASGNWSGGVPNAQDAVADLNRPGGISADRTVTLDVGATVGTLTMDDASDPYNSWLIGSTAKDRVSPPICFYGMSLPEKDQQLWERVAEVEMVMR